MKTYTKAELIEEFDELREVVLKKGIKVVNDGKKTFYKELLIREATTKDQINCGNDVRAKKNDMAMSAILVSLVTFKKIGDDQYTKVTLPEVETIKLKDSSIIADVISDFDAEIGKDLD